MELAHMSLDAAAREMIMDKLAELGGDGGMIGLDRDGNIVDYFNTPGMIRAFVKSDGTKKILIYKGKTFRPYTSFITCATHP